MRTPPWLFITSAIAMAAISAAAQADVKLIKSNPAANATVSRPTKIELSFSDRIIGATAISQLVMMSMPGMSDHPPMMMRDYSAQMSKDGKTMTLLLRRPLPAGTYDVKWEATGIDKHRVKGVVSFTVK